MPKPFATEMQHGMTIGVFGRKGSRTLQALFSMLLLSAAHAAEPLDFDKTFNDHGEPARMHFRAGYLLNGTPHEVELWRDRGSSLKRRTDNAIETFVFKGAADPEWRMVLLDLKRKVRTDVDRTNLLRIGHFTDWFSLSHALARPAGTYQLIAVSAPDGIEKPLSACKWYSLTHEGAQSRICWSSSLRLPLLIASEDNVVQWRVTYVDSKVGSKDIFRINDDGFVKNDANSDIHGD